MDGDVKFSIPFKLCLAQGFIPGFLDGSGASLNSAFEMEAKLDFQD